MWPMAFFLFLILASASPLNAAVVEVDVIHSQDAYPAGGSYPILFKLRIAHSYFIHGPKGIEEDAFLIPTVLYFPGSSGVTIEGFEFPIPEKKTFGYSRKEMELYSGDVLTRGQIIVAAQPSLGNLTLDGSLSYQACTEDSCVPPEELPIQVTLSIVPAGTKVTKLNQDLFHSERTSLKKTGKLSEWVFGSSLWLTLFGIFLGGMALNLTPCIYPLIPITVSYFGGMSDQFRGKTIMHGTLYVLGLALTNSILGFVASLTGSMVGILLQKTVVLVAVAGILICLALSFFGLWEMRLPAFLNKAASTNFRGYFGTFFMGSTLGIVAAPCLGPFILALLTYVAQQGDPFLGFLYFFVLSIGMGFPLAFLAVFSGGLKKLPLSGGWLIWIRKSLGWVLLGMAGTVLMPLIEEPAAKTAVMLLIVGFAGLHLGWLDKTEGGSPRFKYIKRGIGTVLMCLPVPLMILSYLEKEHEGVQWMSYQPALLQQALEKNRPVILDFFAQWCAPCKEMDKKVFTDPELVEMSQQIEMIRADLTSTNPYQKELKTRYQVRGVPTILFINQHGQVERDLTIESFADKNEILERMKRLIQKRPFPDQRSP